MNLKNAAVRGVRTFFQALAAALLGLPVAESLSDIKVVGALWVVALYVAGTAGVVSFLQNAAEDNTTLEIPK